MTDSSSSIRRLLNNPWFIGGLVAIVIACITWLSFSMEPRAFDPGGPKYTAYNNYLIFKYSFFHLAHYQDLYLYYPTEHWDLYKYTPTFSLWMFPFAYLPNGCGLLCWNLLNALVLFAALWKLPLPAPRPRWALMAFVLLELITSVQNTQCNGLMAGLLVFAFIFLEKKKLALGTLMIVIAVFIKPFAIVGLAMCIFYPGKIRSAIYTLCWTVLFLFLPLVVISFSQLIFLYKQWFHLLQTDHGASIGLSVAGWMKSWFEIDLKNTTIIMGGILLCLPLLKIRAYKDFLFRLFFLSSVLIWVVIFNYKAESPTFIIAITGVAVWIFSQSPKTVNIILLILVYVFTILSPTDLFPRNLRDHYVIPYVLKAVPCILVWIKLMVDMVFYKPVSDNSHPV